MSPDNRRRLGELLRRQHGVLSRAQARTAGLSDTAIDRRIGPGGEWVVVLPAIFAVAGGPLTADQRAVAACLYAGRTAVISGAEVLRRRGLRAVGSPSRVVTVVPAHVQRASRGFVVVRRSRRPPSRVPGRLPLAPLPRAVVDACLGVTDERWVRAVVAESVQRNEWVLPELEAEVAQAPRRGTAVLRSVMAEVQDSVRSAPEAEVRRLVQSSGVLGPALYNCRLLGPDGRHLADPDAYWPEAGVVHETDSREWHLSPDAWEATMARHSRMTACGLLVVHSSPHRVRRAGASVLAELEAAYVAGLRTGPPLGVTCVSRAASG